MSLPSPGLRPGLTESALQAEEAYVDDYGAWHPESSRSPGLASARHGETSRSLGLRIVLLEQVLQVAGVDDDVGVLPILRGLPDLNLDAIAARVPGVFQLRQVEHLARQDV